MRVRLPPRAHMKIKLEGNKSLSFESMSNDLLISSGIADVIFKILKERSLIAENLREASDCRYAVEALKSPTDASLQRIRIRVDVPDSNDPSIFREKAAFIIEKDGKASDFGQSLAADQLALIKEIAQKT